MTMITPSYLGETIEYSSLHACRSTLEDPTPMLPRQRARLRVIIEALAQILLGWYGSGSHRRLRRLGGQGSGVLAKGHRSPILAAMLGA